MKLKFGQKQSQDLYLKSKFRQFGAKTKTSDIFKNVYTSQFEGTEYESDIGILGFFIQNLNFCRIVPKLKSYWVYLKVCTGTNLKVIKTNMTALYKRCTPRSEMIFSN